jgi:hypothetical protein
MSTANNTEGGLASRESWTDSSEGVKGAGDGRWDLGECSTPAKLAILLDEGCSGSKRGRRGHWVPPDQRYRKGGGADRRPVCATPYQQIPVLLPLMTAWGPARDSGQTRKVRRPLARAFAATSPWRLEYSFGVLAVSCRCSFET